MTKRQGYLVQVFWLTRFYPSYFLDSFDRSYLKLGDLDFFLEILNN